MYWVLSLKSDYEKLTGTDFKSAPTEVLPGRWSFYEAIKN
jgi:hypothetical protein